LKRKIFCLKLQIEYLNKGFFYTSRGLYN